MRQKKTFYFSQPPDPTEKVECPNSVRPGSCWQRSMATEEGEGVSHGETEDCRIGWRGRRTLGHRDWDRTREWQNDG